MHSSSEDDDMESPFPNDLSLQQVTWTWNQRDISTTAIMIMKYLFHQTSLVSNDLMFNPQAFSDYQIQQMTANFVDQFGFNDEEFSEHDENIK